MAGEFTPNIRTLPHDTQRQATGHLRHAGMLLGAPIDCAPLRKGEQTKTESSDRNAEHGGNLRREHAGGRVLKDVPQGRERLVDDDAVRLSSAGLRVERREVRFSVVSGVDGQIDRREAVEHVANQHRQLLTADAFPLAGLGALDGAAGRR